MHGRFLQRSAQAMIALLCASALALALSTPAKAQIAPGGLSPQMLQQLRSLPRAQARALAQQYGIDIESYLGAGASEGENRLGQPGEPLTPAQRVNRRGMADDSETFPGLFPGEGPQGEAEETQEEEALVGSSIEALDPAERYGLAFFDAEVSTFAPVDNAPVPQDYRLGPGDQLQVLLLGANNTEVLATVDRFGEVSLPEIGKVAVAGQPFEAAVEMIQNRVAAARIAVEAMVSMGRLRAINVMLAGEVAVPGARSLAGMARLTHALYAAGGLSELGSLRGIEVKRGGETVAQFDSYALLLRGDASQDITLRDGDVVFVPPVANLAGVNGAVRRPGVYELAAGETLADVLAMAGGITERGRSDSLLLERESLNGTPEIIELAEANLNQPAQAGDRLRVQLSSRRFLNRVTLRGAVQRPGVYGHFDSMRLSDVLRSADGDLLEETDYDYALVVSTDAATGRIRVRQFAPAAVFQAPDGPQNLALSPRDEIVLLPRPLGAGLADEEEEEEEAALAMEARQLRFDGALQAGSLPGRGVTEEEDAPESPTQRRLALLEPIVARLEAQASPAEPTAVVTIEGAVHVPGRYPLPVGDDYGLDALIAAAGGFRDDAFLRGIELQRPTPNAQGEVTLTSRSLRAEDPTALRSVKLRGRDRIVVRTVPDWTPTDSVELAGEFRFPGTYVLLPGESLGELISRVGGLTKDAFPYGAVYSAANAAEREREETERFVADIRRTYASQSLTQEQQNTTFADLELAVEGLLARESVGRVAIDLPRILAGDEGADLILSDGDRLFVPRQQATVTVLGEVYRPGSFRFEPGLSLKDYLALGAGTTPRAENQRLYIVRANGRVDRPARDLLRFTLADAALRPGDTIVVPVNASYRNPLDFWTDITQVAYQTGIAVAAVLRN